MSFSICDGTNPHVVEPAYPGVIEKVVSLYDLMDTDYLSTYKDELINFTKANKNMHMQSKQATIALKSVLNNSNKIISLCYDFEKLNKFLIRLNSKIIKQKTEKIGTENVRFLSAITCEGMIFYEDTAFKLVDYIYEINDNYGFISNEILQSVKSKAISHGYDVITCYCPLSPNDKLEHLFIPELNIGFLTSNQFHKVQNTSNKKINTGRFVFKDDIKKFSNRLSFNKKLANELVIEIISIQEQAKMYHNKMEEIYLPSIDFTRMDDVFDNIIKSIK